MKNKKRISLILAVTMIAVILSAFLCLPPVTASAATYTVTNSNSTGTGSLREAITAANASAGNIITFSPTAFPTGTVTEIILTSSLPAITRNLTIQGHLQTSGANKDKPAISIKRSTVAGTGDFRILLANGGSALELKLYGLSIENGQTTAYSAGAYSTGSLTAERCAFIGNKTTHYGGGAFATRGSLILKQCTFTGNTATQSGGGAYIDNGSLVAQNCTFEDNLAGLNGGGLCILSGSATVENCLFRDNEATGGGGGGMYSQTSVTTENCIFMSNTATNNGGGLWGPALSVRACTFAGNTATNNGGGAYTNTGSSTIENCTVTGNTANNGGGVYADLSSLTVQNCTFAGNTANGDGGGIASTGNSTTAENCIFTENTAVGGSALRSSSRIVAVNTMFTQNNAEGHFGTIESVNSSVYLYHCTVADNTGSGVNARRNTIAWIYAYNSILAGNGGGQMGYGTTEFTPMNSLSGGVSLVEGISNVTCAGIFGTKSMAVNGILRPVTGGLAYRTADALTAAALTGSGLTDMTKFATDLEGATRLTSGKVNYGAVETARILVENIAISDAPEKVATGTLLSLRVKVGPESAADKSVSWTSSDTKIAEVSNGRVLPLNPGKVIITATANDGSGVSGSCEIVVIRLVTKVAISGAPANMIKGTATTLQAIVTPTNATNRDLSWTSSDSNIAAVDQNGRVTAVNPGTVTITVTAKDESGEKDTCTITVLPDTISVTKVAISGAPVNMVKGTTATLKATVTPTNATNKAVTWSSSNKSVATVTNGVVKAVASGTVTITVTTQDGKKTAQCAITVHSYVSMRIGNTKAIQNGIKTTIDNAGTKPFKISGKTMLPLRFVGEKMGAKVTYVNDKTPIKMVYGKITVEFKLGSKTMTIDNDGKKSTKVIDVSAQKKDTKTYIPLRAIGEALGFDVYYDSATEIIVVNNPKMTKTVRDERLIESKNYIK